uniref:Uncharacterized protein n=1 Tax=Steinernema glaseri TaxID=37863 RepID=A0A1I7ZB99_9BILA
MSSSTRILTLAPSAVGLIHIKFHGFWEFGQPARVMSERLTQMPTIRRIYKSHHAMDYPLAGHYLPPGFLLDCTGDERLDRVIKTASWVRASNASRFDAPLAPFIAPCSHASGLSIFVNSWLTRATTREVTLSVYLSRLRLRRPLLSVSSPLSRATVTDAFVPQREGFMVRQGHLAPPIVAPDSPRPQKVSAGQDLFTDATSPQSLTIPAPRNNDQKKADVVRLESIRIETENSGAKCTSKK